MADLPAVARAGKVGIQLKAIAGGLQNSRELNSGPQIRSLEATRRSRQARTRSYQSTCGAAARESRRRERMVVMFELPPTPVASASKFQAAVKNRSCRSTFSAPLPGSPHRSRRRPSLPHGLGLPSGHLPGSQRPATDLARDVVANGPPCAGRRCRSCPRNRLSRFEAASAGSRSSLANNGPLMALGRYGNTAAGSGTRRNDCSVFLPMVT